MIRILVTGSRHHRDQFLIYTSLTSVTAGLIGDGMDGPIVLVHGGADGADKIAKEWAESSGYKPEEHKARWTNEGFAAGPIRNQKMVDLGADICVAFPEKASKRTWDCLRRARTAGIPVRIIEGSTK